MAANCVRLALFREFRWPESALLHPFSIQKRFVVKDRGKLTTKWRNFVSPFQDEDQEEQLDVGPPTVTIGKVRKAFKKASKNDTTQNILNKFLSQDLRIPIYQELLAMTQKYNLQPFGVFEGMIAYCLSKKYFDKAREFAQQARQAGMIFYPKLWERFIVRQGFSPKDSGLARLAITETDAPKTLVDYNALLSDALKRKDFERINQLINEMRTENIPFNAYTFQVLFSLAKQKLLDPLELYEESREMGVRLSRLSFELLLQSIPEGSSESVEIFNDAISLGIVPSSYMINSVLKPYSRAGNFQAVMTVWRQYFIKDDEGNYKIVQPYFMSYELVLRCCVHAYENEPNDEIVTVFDDLFEEACAEQTNNLKDHDRFHKLSILYELQIMWMCVQHDPNAPQFFSEHFDRLSLRSKHYVLTSMLKMALDMQDVALADLVLQKQQNAKPKINLRQVQLLYLAKLFCETDDVEKAVHYIEQMHTISLKHTQQPRLEHDWQSLRDKIIVLGRQDLLERLDLATSTIKL